MFGLKGALEILQTATSSKPKSFKDFTKISIKKRKLSSATISKRLDELIAVDAIKEVITRSTSGRRIISYQTTEKGKELVERTKELNEIFTNSKSK